MVATEPPLPGNRFFICAAALSTAFRRVTSSGGYLPEIDGLRFIAIGAVVAVHTWGYLNRSGLSYDEPSRLDGILRRVLPLGSYGVHLFFMISGFILAVPFCKHVLEGAKKVELRKYFWRRLTRLEPPYVISMVLFFATMPLFGKGTYQALWPHLLASLAYVHNIVYDAGSLINNNAWSLEIEVQFYVLMPLIAGVLSASVFLRRTALTLGAVGLSLHSVWLPSDFPKTILQYGQYFLVGILLCDVWMSSWKTIPRSWLADLPGAVAIVAFFGVNLKLGGLACDALNPWIFGLFFGSALLGTGHGKVLTYGAIPLIGGMCYSIYLLHARVIAFVVHGVLAKLPLTGSFAGDYLIALVTCAFWILLISGCYYLLIEKPCMNPAWPALLWHRLLAGRSTPKTAPTREVSL